MKEEINGLLILSLKKVKIDYRISHCMMEFNET